MLCGYAAHWNICIVFQMKHNEPSNKIKAAPSFYYFLKTIRIYLRNNNNLLYINAMRLRRKNRHLLYILRATPAPPAAGKRRYTA